MTRAMDDPQTPEQVEQALWRGIADHLRTFDDTCPAFEDDPDTYEILSWAVEPGDALLFDFRTVHRSGPNAGANRRAALSWRWLGDDACYLERKGEVSIPTTDPGFADGEKFLGEDFPTVWRAD